MNYLRTTENRLGLLKNKKSLNSLLGPSGARRNSSRPDPATGTSTAFDNGLPHNVNSNYYSSDVLARPSRQIGRWTKFGFVAPKLKLCQTKQAAATAAISKRDLATSTQQFLSASQSGDKTNSVPTLDRPLINPGKASPDAVAPPQPIQPLTAPRFTRQTSSKGESLPSVTRVLSATMPAANAFLLEKWKESMIKKLGVAGFNKYQQETFERGRLLHALLESYLLGKGEPLEGQAALSKEIVCNLWRSIRNVIKDKISNVRLVEHTITHSEMKYRGIVDCVAFYEGELVVIDFKTAEKPKKDVESLYDNPIQVSAYCGALNNDMSIPSHVIDRNVVSGLVIVAYVDGSEASCYYLKAQELSDKYWKQWLKRLDQYTKMSAFINERSALHNGVTTLNWRLR